MVPRNDWSERDLSFFLSLWSLILRHLLFVAFLSFLLLLVLMTGVLSRGCMTSVSEPALFVSYGLSDASSPGVGYSWREQDRDGRQGGSRQQGTSPAITGDHSK